MSEDKNSHILLTSESPDDLSIPSKEESNERETRASIPIHSPNYEYLEQIKTTDYFFLSYKNMPLIFYTFTTFTIIILISSIFYLKIKIIFIFIIFGIFFVIMGAFPYGIYVKLIKEDKTLVMEKKCMISMFSRFINEKYSLFDLQEFVLLKKEINNDMSSLKIDLVLMNGKSITIFNEWILKEDEPEFVEKTKRLNEFVNKT